MLPPADPIGARPPRAVEPVTPARPINDPRREVFDRLTQIALGNTFRAEVLSRLNDGSYVIKLANAVLRAALPGNTQVGTSLSLKFVATQPRPTFLLLQGAETDTTLLSPAAKLIDSVLHASKGESKVEAVLGKLAIMPEASIDSSKIATALKHTMAASGLFYESHLSQWAGGARPLAALQQEPQAQFKADAFRMTSSLPQLDKTSSSQLIDVVSSWEDGAAPGTPSAGAALTAAADPNSKEMMQLMNLQLQALEHQKVVWQGELWPGQPLEWEVSEDPQQSQNDEDAAPSWTSTVRFSLPTLGTVSATIRIVGDQMDMQLRAASEQTADLLRERGGELASALDAAGSPLDALTVKQDDQA